jgi:hypothetical protein
VPVEWWALLVAIAALVVSVGLRLYDYSVGPRQRRIDRVRPLLIQLRNRFATMGKVKSLDFESLSRELDDTFFVELANLYRLAVEEGLDFVLDKEFKSVKQELADFTDRLEVHRAEIKEYRGKEKLSLASLMIDDSRVLYVILETPKAITNWLKKHP